MLMLALQELSYKIIVNPSYDKSDLKPDPYIFGAVIFYLSELDLESNKKASSKANGKKAMVSTWVPNQL